jgi:hypothetical protein
MYPHERSLVEKHAGKPFVILGVNSDPKEKLKSIMDSKTVTWRSFWDGGNTRGPIATRWNVSGWPTIYVLDHEGVIRFKNVREKALDDAIETLMKEAEGL